MATGPDFFNTALELRIGLLTKEHRQIVLEKYGFTTSKPMRGSLVQRYKQMIRWAKKALRGKPDVSFLDFVQRTTRGYLTEDE